MNMQHLGRGIAKVVLLLALGAGVTGIAPIFTATPAEAQTAMRFSSIQVVGNQRIEAATVRNFANIPTGKAVTPGQVNSAYQRLINTQLFEEVDVTPRGGTLIITVREFPTISRINFERNRKLKDEKLAELIGSRTRHAYNPAQAEADAAIIVEAYRQAGRQTAEVTPKIIRRSDNRVDLVFEIFEGKVVEVERISFVGNRQFSDRRLRAVLESKQAGLFRALIKSDTFIADRVEFDKQVLRDFYVSRGFIDFEVLSTSAESVRERNGFFLTFKLREGQQYSFGEITTTSDLAEIDPDEFAAVIRVKPGVTYAPNLLEATIERMETLATRKGLNFIRVTPRVNRNDRARTLDIEFVIEKGERLFVERIDIEGNETTLDRVVRRQFDTVEGDPFNPRKIREASDRINALGFFSRADVQTREGTSADQVIVDVNVEEQNTGSLSFGVTYSSSANVGGTLSLSESNFLGRGQFVRAELGGGTTNSNTTLTFAEPQFLDRNLRFEISLFRDTTSQQNVFYDTIVSGLTPSLSFPVSEFGRAKLTYRINSDTLNNVTGTPSTLVTADVGTRSTSALALEYTFDNRSGGLNPRAGVILRVSQEIAGFGGDAQFSKTTAMIGGRTTIFGDVVSLSAELEGGFLTDFGGTGSHISDRFFLGPAIMRGYQFRGMGPRDLSVANQDALGGTTYAVARLEANFPLGLPEEYGIKGGLFMDIGSLWGLDRASAVPISETVGLASTTMQMRVVAGFSIFWETPVGPLRFNFMSNLRGPSYDQSENFSLAIGTSF